MDISAYYDKFQSSYNWALAAVILGIFTAVFCCVRTIIDKSDECRPIWKKVVYCIGYVLIFGFVVGLFFRGPYLMKKDIDQQSIYAYEGEFEMVELIPGYNQKPEINHHRYRMPADTASSIDIPSGVGYGRHPVTYDCARHDSRSIMSRRKRLKLHHFPIERKH